MKVKFTILFKNVKIPVILVKINLISVQVVILIKKELINQIKKNVLALQDSLKTKIIIVKVL